MFSLTNVTLTSFLVVDGKQQIKHVGIRCSHIDIDVWYIYLRKRTASPETRFFWLTKLVHPVVSRCRLGWPETTVYWIKSPSSIIHSEMSSNNLCKCDGTSTPLHANPWQQAPERASVVCNPATWHVQHVWIIMNWSRKRVGKRVIPEVQNSLQQLYAEQKILHGCWYQMQSRSCRTCEGLFLWV